MRPNLALSLNASNDEVRREIMPITRKWNIAALLEAVQTIPLGRREYVTFEYVLLGGVNDQPEHAREVLALLKGMQAKVESDRLESGAGDCLPPAHAGGRGCVSQAARRGWNSDVYAAAERAGYLRGVRAVEADGRDAGTGRHCAASGGGMREPVFVPLPDYFEYSPDEMQRRATGFRKEMQRRRTVREFSDHPVPREIIAECLVAAGTAPNGANLQPWHFVVVSDAAKKHEIRTAAEREEKEFYTHKAPPEWLDALAPLGTDEHKPFLEMAPVLIVIFAQTYAQLTDGRKLKNYYVQESVGIATGFLIAALHNAGLASLTHTPNPMGFLNQLLGRPLAGAALLDSGGRLPRGRCEGTEDCKEAAGRNRHVCLDYPRRERIPSSSSVSVTRS